MDISGASPQASVSAQSRRWFYYACAGEAALIPLAAVLGYFFEPVPWTHWRWSVSGLLVGLAAAVPPFVLFVRMLKFRTELLADVRRAMEESIRPLFAHWSIWQLAVISLLAGVGEEFLFRGFLQLALENAIGPVWSLLVASLLFGCVHPITLNYALVTAVVGVYLGCLMMATGNLLAPVATHAAYDFAALVYFLRIHRASPGAASTDETPG